MMLSSMLILSVPMLSYFSHLPQILYSFYNLCSVPFPVLFYPNASLLVRTHFFSASLCPFTCFPFSRVFHASWLSQSTFSLPPGVTVLQIRAARSSSCSREQAEQREMELMAVSMYQSWKRFCFSLLTHRYYLWRRQRRDLTHKEVKSLIVHWSRSNWNNFPEWDGPVIVNNDHRLFFSIILDLFFLDCSLAFLSHFTNTQTSQFIL